MKEQCPVIMPKDEKGNTEINPQYVAFMQHMTIGRYPEELNLEKREAYVIQRHLQTSGIDIPVSDEWFATRNQRRILHACAEGARSYPELEEATGIGYEALRVHVKALRQNNIQVRLTRANNIALKDSPQENEDGNHIEPLSETDILFLQGIAEGKKAKDLGMSTNWDVADRIQHLRKRGIDFPTFREWKLTPGDRKVIVAIDNGAQNSFEISQMTGISNGDVASHVRKIKNLGIELKVKIQFRSKGNK